MYITILKLLLNRPVNTGSEAILPNIPFTAISDVVKLIYVK